MLTDVDFLRTIRAAPDDDAPRLVYADWLEDRGDAARAAFIRVQIELARTKTDHRRRAELLAANASLCDEVTEQSLRAFGGVVGECWFERGVLVGVAMRTIDFLQQVEVLFDSTAIIDVRLSQLAGHVDALSDCRRLPEVRSLGLRRLGIRTEELTHFLQTPGLSRLRSLDLGGNQLPASVLRDVVGSSLFQSLESFEFWRNHCTGLMDLQVAATAIRTIDLELNHLSESTVAGMAVAGLFEHLSSLRLSRNRFGSTGVRAFLQSPTMTRLTVLELAQCDIDDDGVFALAHARELLGLEEIDLSHNDIGPSGAAQLARAYHLASLRRIDLRGNHFSKAEARLLQRRFGSRVVM